MDAWDPHHPILRDLSSNHTVIIFGNCGVGNTTADTRPFSIRQFVVDIVGWYTFSLVFYIQFLFLVLFTHFLTSDMNRDPTIVTYRFTIEICYAINN